MSHHLNLNNFNFPFTAMDTGGMMMPSNINNGNTMMSANNNGGMFNNGFVQPDSKDKDFIIFLYRIKLQTCHILRQEKKRIGSLDL